MGMASTTAASLHGIKILAQWRRDAEASRKKKIKYLSSLTSASLRLCALCENIACCGGLKMDPRLLDASAGTTINPPFAGSACSARVLLHGDQNNVSGNLQLRGEVMP